MKIFSLHTLKNLCTRFVLRALFLSFINTSKQILVVSIIFNFKGLTFPFTKKVNHDAPQAVNRASCMFHGSNLEPPLSGHLMEVGRSIEVCQVCRKFAYSLAETSLYFETNARGEKHYWSTIGRQLLSYFPFIIFLK